MLMREGFGVGGALNSSKSRLDSHSVVHATIEEHAVAVGDFLIHLSSVLGRQLEGVVGYNFLRQFLVTIDYPQTTLELAAV